MAIIIIIIVPRDFRVWICDEVANGLQLRTFQCETKRPRAATKDNGQR